MKWAVPIPVSPPSKSGDRLAPAVLDDPVHPIGQG